MISEEQQDQAALHAFGLLPADEAERLERAMDADAELRDLARSLREAAAALALGAPVATPPPALRARVLGEIARENPAVKPKGAKVVPFRLPAWVPWAVAASLLATCGYFVNEQTRLRGQLAELNTEQVQLRDQLAEVRAADPLSQLSLFSLAAGEQGPPSARATVAWEPVSQHGVLRLTGLPAPAPGKDYQLWAIGAGDQGPVSAGVVHVDASGAARVGFHPVAPVAQVAAFAISLERDGGSPAKPEGPILLAPRG